MTAWQSPALAARILFLQTRSPESADLLAAPALTIHVRLFALYREAAGQDEIALTVPAGADIRRSDRIEVQGTLFEVLGGFQSSTLNVSDTYSLAEIQA